LIAFEVAFIFVVAIVLVVSIATLGKPLAEAYAEKLKTKYREIGSQEAHALRERLSLLEEEILEIRSQLKSVQENSEYTIKLLESSQGKITKIINE
jgi:peptidoglycan hydrolase CwlO-like protein